MSTDSFTSALERLDPASRALLDLSLRRGMRTEEIADVLGAEPANVEASRDEALRRIAADVGMDTAGDLDEVRARLAELPVEGWIGGRVAANGNGAHAPVKEPEPTAPAEEPRRRRRALPLLLGLLVIAAVIVAVVLGSSGSSTSNKASNSTPAPSAPKPAGSDVAFVPVSAGIKARGSAGVKGNRLNLRITGLPKDRYGVWLFNNVIDARSLGYAQGTTIVGRNLQLPRNWRSYRYVDVSRERNDGNLNHSGLSVMRVPTGRLAAGS